MVSGLAAPYVTLPGRPRPLPESVVVAATPRAVLGGFATGPTEGGSEVLSAASVASGATAHFKEECMVCPLVFRNI